MAIIHSVLRFAYDGSIASSTPGAPTIVPGVDAVWQCESESADGAEVSLTNLRGARLMWELRDPAGHIVMWYEDAPFFAIIDDTDGLFEAHLLAGRTDLLASGTHTLEIKAAYPDGTRSRIAYAAVAVADSGMAGQP